MPSPRPLRVSWPLVLLCAALGCSTPAHYGPEEDVAALSRIVGRWASADGATALTLCEDAARAEAEPADGCVVEHVARGDGSGPTHEASDPDGLGCGGCPFAAVAYVRGTLVHAGREVPVRGQVWLGSDGEPYALPYGLDLRCEGAGAACGMLGERTEDGRLELMLEEDGLPTSAPPVELRLTGPAPCASGRRRHRRLQRVPAVGRARPVEVVRQRARLGVALHPRRPLQR